MFLQRYVHVVLDAVLGSYVKNIDPKALQISVWNGKIEVKTVELQPDAFPLPKQMRLVKGTLRQLRIDLPWTNLAGQPIRVDIEDVSLLLEVCTDDRAASDAVAPTPEEQRRAAKKKQQDLKRKRAAIDAVEKATEFNEQNNAQTDVGQSWTQSFLCKLLVKALDNVQVHVQHLHLRMEDAVSDPGCPYAVGMTLDAIIIKSADEGWNYTMVGRGTSPPHGMSFIRKKMDVNKFGIYWSLPLVPVPETALNDAEAFAALMRSSFKPAKKQTQPQVVQPVPSPLTESARAQDATMLMLFKPSDYIVHPLTVSMKLTINDGNAKLSITHQELSERVLSRLGTSWMVETIDAIGDDAWNDFLKIMPKLAGERKYTLGFVFSEAWSVARDLTEEEDEIPSVLQFKRALSSCMQWSLEEVDRVEQCIIRYREAVVHVMEEKSTYIDAQASIDQIGTSLHRQQYLSALSFISFFTAMRRQARYLVLRPKRIRVRNDPRAWWRYAINAVLLDVRERLAHVDWGALETKQRQKDRYKKLCILVEHSTTFAATLVPSDMRLLSKEIACSELEDLEYVMDVQELIKLRRAVRKEIADTEKEQQALRSNGGSDYRSGGRPPLGPEPSTGARLWSYAAWLTGASGSAYGSTDHGAGEVRVEDVKWSDQDANDLYKAIDFHPKREKVIEELDNDEVKDAAEREKQLLQNHQHILYRFQLTLCRASFELSLEDVHTDLRDRREYSNVELSSSSCLNASLDDVEIQFLVRPSSVELGLQLRDAFFSQGSRLSVHDESSLEKRSVSSSGTRFFLQRMDIDEVVEYHPVGVRNQMSSVRLRYCEKELPLVQLSIECARQRKIGMASDSMNANGDVALATRDVALAANLFRVSLVTQPIRCNVNLMFLLNVMAVFSRPVNVDLSGLEHSAWKKAQSLQRSSAAQLRDALARRTMVEVRLDVISPLINFIQATMPETRVFKGDEVSLLVFLGHLKAQTKHPSDVMDESKMTEELGDCTMGTTASQMVVLAPSEECLYDVLEINISGIEVQIIDGENISGGNRVFLSRIHSCKKSSWHYLLEKTSLTFNFYMSVTPDDPSIPLLKLSGGVDHVNLNLSARSFRSLVQLMHSFGENLSLHATRRMRKDMAAAAHKIDHPARYLATAVSRCRKQKIVRKASSYMNLGDIALSSSDPGGRHTTASGNSPYTHLSKKIQLERQKTFREKEIDDNDLLKLWERVICQLQFGIGEIILTLQVREPGNGSGKTVCVRAVDISTRLQIRSYDRRLDFALGTLLVEDILLLRSSSSSKVVEKKRFLMKSGNHEVVIDAEQKSKEEPIKPPTSSEQLIHVAITGIASDAVMLKDKQLWKSVRHAPLSSSSGKNSVWQDPLITALSVDASLRVLTIDVYQDTLADVFVFFFRQSKEDADVKMQALRPPLLSLRSIGEGSTTGRNDLATNIDDQSALSPVDAQANENTFSRKLGVWVTSSFLDNHLGASPKREDEQQTAANKQCGIAEENQPAAMQSRLNVEGLSLFLHLDDKQRLEGMSSAFASLTAQQFCCCVQRFPLHLSVFAYLTSLKIHDVSLLDQHLSEIVSHGDTSTKPDEDKLWNDRDAACEYDDDIALGHIPTQCEILNLLDRVPAVFSCAVQFYGVDTIQEVWHPGYSSRYTVRLKSPRIRFLYSFVDDMCNYWMKGVLLATILSILSREQTDTLWEGDFQLAGIQGSPASQKGNEEEEDAKVEASSSTISSPDVVSMFPLIDIYLEDAVLEMPPHRMSSESLLLRFDTFRASNRNIVDSFLGMENRVVAKVLLNSSLKQLQLDMKALRIVSVILMDHNDADKRLESGGLITQSLLGLTNYSLSVDFRSHVDMKVSIICSPVRLVCNQDQYAFVLRVPFQNYRERTRYNFRPGAEVPARVVARASSRRLFLRHSVDGFSSSGRFIEDGDEASDGTSASEVPEATEEHHIIFDLHVPEITMEILQGQHGYHPSSSGDLDMAKKSKANDASICLLALSVLSARANYDLVNQRLTADVDLEGVHIRDSRVHSKMSASYRDVIVFERCRDGLPKAVKLQLVRENFDVGVSTIRFDPHRHKLRASGTRFRRTSSRASVGLFGSEISLRRTESEISAYSLKSPTVANRGVHCDNPREKTPFSSLVGVEERMELVIDVAGFKVIPSNIHYELIEFLTTPPSWSTEDVDSVSSRGNEETGNANSEESTVVPPTYRRIGLELNLGPSAFLLVEDPYKLKSRAMVLSWESSLILNYLRQTNEDECPDVEGIGEEYPAHSRNQLQICVDLENIYATSRLSEESIWAAEQAATAASADCLKPIGMESVFQVDLRSHFVRFQTTFDRVMELRFGYLDFCTMLAAFEHVLRRPLTTSQSSAPRGQNRRSMSGSSISSLSGGGADSESASCGGRQQCPSSPRSSLALFMLKRCERQCTAALYGTSLIYLVSASFRGRLETRPVVGFYNSTWRKRYLVLPYTAQQRQLVQSVAFRILPASESRRQIGDEVYYGDRIILEAVVTTNQEKTEEKSSKVTLLSKEEASDASPTAGKETVKLPHSTLIQKYDQLGANGYLGPEGSAGVFETTIWKHGSTMFNSDKSVIYDRELIVFEEVTIYRSFSKGKTFDAANDAGQQMDFNLSRSGHQAEGAHTVDATSARGGGYLMFNGVGDAPIPFALSIVSGTSRAGCPQREEQSPTDADNVDTVGDALNSSADASVTTHPPETPSASARSGNKKRKSLFAYASFLDNLKILEFTLPGVNATIVNDFHNMLLPLLHFRVAALNADIRGRIEYKFTALTSLRFGIQAYNSQLAVWEPVLEDFEMNMAYHGMGGLLCDYCMSERQSVSPTGAALRCDGMPLCLFRSSRTEVFTDAAAHSWESKNYIYRELLEQPDVQDGAKLANTFMIVAKDDFNINVSRNVINVLVHFFALVTEVTAADEALSSRLGPFIYVDNQSGIPFVVATHPSSSVGAASTAGGTPSSSRRPTGSIEMPTDVPGADTNDEIVKAGTAMFNSLAWSRRRLSTMLSDISSADTRWIRVESGERIATEIVAHEAPAGCVTSPLRRLLWLKPQSHSQGINSSKAIPVPIGYSNRSYLHLESSGKQHDSWHGESIICETVAEQGTLVLRLRGKVQLMNFYDVPIQIIYNDQREETIEPGGMTAHYIPIQYLDSGSIAFRPLLSNGEVQRSDALSIASLLRSNDFKYCGRSKRRQNVGSLELRKALTFYWDVHPSVGVEDGADATFGVSLPPFQVILTALRKSERHETTITLRPPIVLENLVPYELSYRTVCMKSEAEVVWVAKNAASFSGANGKVPSGSSACLAGLDILERDLENGVVVQTPTVVGLSLALPQIELRRFSRWSSDAFIYGCRSFCERIELNMRDDSDAEATTIANKLTICVEITQLEKLRSRSLNTLCPVVCRVFTEYWLIDRTSLSLAFYTADDYLIPSNHPGRLYEGNGIDDDNSSPVSLSVFSCESKQSVSKMKIGIKGNEGEREVQSDPFDISAVGVRGQILVPTNRSRDARFLLSTITEFGAPPGNLKSTFTQYEFGVMIEQGPEKFLRSRVVTLVPRYYFINTSSRFEIHVRQERSTDPSSVIMLRPNDSKIFHWSDSRLPFRVQVCFVRPDKRHDARNIASFVNSSQWTAPFELSAVGNFVLRVKSKVRPAPPCLPGCFEGGASNQKQVEEVEDMEEEDDERNDAKRMLTDGIQLNVAVELHDPSFLVYLEESSPSVHVSPSPLSECEANYRKHAPNKKQKKEDEAFVPFKIKNECSNLALIVWQKTRLKDGKGNVTIGFEGGESVLPFHSIDYVPFRFSAFPTVFIQVQKVAGLGVNALRKKHALRGHHGDRMDPKSSGTERKKDDSPVSAISRAAMLDQAHVVTSFEVQLKKLQCLPTIDVSEGSTKKRLWAEVLLDETTKTLLVTDMLPGFSGEHKRRRRATLLRSWKRYNTSIVYISHMLSAHAAHLANGLDNDLIQEAPAPKKCVRFLTDIAKVKTKLSVEEDGTLRATKLAYKADSIPSSTEGEKEVEALALCARLVDAGHLEEVFLQAGRSDLTSCQPFITFSLKTAEGEVRTKLTPQSSTVFPRWLPALHSKATLSALVLCNDSGDEKNETRLNYEFGTGAEIIVEIREADKVLFGSSIVAATRIPLQEYCAAAIISCRNDANYEAPVVEFLAPVRLTQTGGGWLHPLGNETRIRFQMCCRRTSTTRSAIAELNGKGVNDHDAVKEVTDILSAYQLKKELDLLLSSKSQLKMLLEHEAVDTSTSGSNIPAALRPALDCSTQEEKNNFTLSHLVAGGDDNSADPCGQNANSIRGSAASVTTDGSISDGTYDEMVDEKRLTAVLIGVSNLQIPTEVIRDNFKHTHRKVEHLEPKVYCTITYQKSTRSALSAIAKSSSVTSSMEQDKSDDSKSTSSGGTSMAGSPSNHAHLQQVRTHEFLQGQVLGLDLVYRNGRVLVQGVVCDGPCGALVYEGKIRIGDTVVAVNKKSIVNLHRNASFAVIEKAMHWGEGIGSQIPSQASRSTFTLSFLYQPTMTASYTRPPCAQSLCEEAGVRRYDAEWNRRVEFVETPNTKSAAESGDEQVLVRVYLRNETSDHGLSASQESSIVPFLFFFGDDAMMDHLDHSKQDSRFDVLLAECWVPLPPSSLPNAGNLMSMHGNPMAEPSALTFNERICALYSPQQRSRQHSALEMIGQLRLALKWDFINPLRAAHQQRDLSLHFQLEVARICISVADDGAWSSMASATGPQQPREVLCVSLSDQNASAGVQLSYGQISDGKKVLNARIGHFQIDNQLLDTNYPVLLRPIRLLDAQTQEEGYTMARGEGGKENAETGQVEIPMLLPTVQLMTVFSHQPNVVQFDYIFGQLQELEIKLEDATLVSLARVFSGVKWSHPASNSRMSKQDKRSSDGFGSNLALKLLEIEWSTPSLLSAAAGGRLDSTTSGGGANMKVLLRWLLLCPVKVNVTFTSTADRSLLLSLLSPDMSSALSTLISAAAALVSNLDQAPIRIPEFYVENLLETTHTLAFYAMQHYLHHGLRSWYSIMGSVDFLGNPIGLVSTLGTGVKDFFYTPAQMLLEDENGLRIDNLRTGMTKGSKSLLRNTAVGIFHTTGKITETLGKGVALLAMDEQYYAQRQRASTRQIKKINDIGDGIAEGSKGLVGGVWDGIKGVVAAPVRGAEQDGAGGFVVGIGKGVAGLIAKPTAGFLDLLTSLSRGAKTSAQSLDGTDRNAYDVITRFRLPRRICSDGVLVSYSEREARGYAVLLLTPLDATDEYVYHVDYGIEPHRGLLLLTDKRLICLSGKTGQKLWEVALDSTLAIVVEGTSLKIGQNTSPSRSYNIECDSEVAATNFQVAVDSARVDVSTTRYLLLNLEKSQEESRIAGGGRFSSATTGLLTNDEDRTDLHVLMENVQDTTVSGVSNDDLRSQPLRSVRVEVCHLQNKDAHANVPDRAIDKLLSFSVFQVQVYGGPYQWTVFRRFSEFRELCAKLEGAGYVLDGLPLLPPRTFLPSTRAPVAKHRQDALNMFLQAAIMHSVISRSAAMLDFLTREAREVRVSLPPLSPAGDREAPQRGDSP
uniref:Vacuolar protein sorting-associated protein n=1 Tax=Peronospora matthiolae TaxID=2874970 RepID=A0AAV1T4Y3_9STRA